MDVRHPRSSDLAALSLGAADRAAPTSFSNDAVSAALLSAVAGYVDTAGFLALYGLFTAHVTGDLVTAGAIVAERLRFGASARLAMIPTFMASVAATALFARAIRRRGNAPLVALLALMTLALATFCATGVALRPFAKGPDEWSVMLIGATGVIAMGVQNTLMRDALRTLSPTTIMTGNLTQFTIDLVEILLPMGGGDGGEGDLQKRTRVRTEVTARLVKFGLPLGGFVLGAALGARLTSSFGLWSIALPTFIVGGLTVVAWRRSRMKTTVRTVAVPNT